MLCCSFWTVGNFGKHPEEQAYFHRDTRCSRDQYGSREVPRGRDYYIIIIIIILLLLLNILALIYHLYAIYVVLLTAFNVSQACENGRGAILLSVARGKVSEGIDFGKYPANTTTI